MKIFYSGTCSADAVPETVRPTQLPDIMMTFYDFKNKGNASMKRFRSFRKFKKWSKENVPF